MKISRTFLSHLKVNKMSKDWYYQWNCLMLLSLLNFCVLILIQPLASNPKRRLIPSSWFYLNFFNFTRKTDVAKIYFVPRLKSLNSARALIIHLTNLKQWEQRQEQQQQKQLQQKHWYLIMCIKGLFLLETIIMIQSVIMILM